MRRYEPVRPISRDQVTTVFAGGDSREIPQALLSIVYYDADWQWSEQQCERFVHHADPGVRGIAVLCFGHLARIHGALRLDRVLPLVEQRMQDRNPWVAGHAHSAWDDIHQYLLNETD